MIINLKDRHEIRDAMSNPDLASLISKSMNGGPTRTSISIVDHDTGEVLQTVHNKVVVPGAQIIACNTFGISPTVPFPTYNTELGLENSVVDYEEQPDNFPITCLWGIGRDGYLSSPNEVVAVSNTDRIEPDSLVPFRYVTLENDLDEDQRDMYYGRKVTEDGHIAYYFKKFDTDPQLHIRYLDGTEVNSEMWNIDSTQQVEVFVEMRLSVSRLDCRDYFDTVLGWENADVSSISLLSAWYRDIPINPEADPEFQTTQRWYQEILPYSKFNFRNEDLSNLSRAVDFIYNVYY